MLSNTLALEELGWKGVLMDVNPNALDCPRKNPFICADATKYNWRDSALLGTTVDYLSLDIDDGSLDALAQLLKADIKFRVITAEHDAYRLGDKLRVPMRKVFREQGYFPLCTNVSCTSGMPYEDWHICQELRVQALPMMCDGKNYTEIPNLL